MVNATVNTAKAVVGEAVMQRITGLHDAKVKINEEKIAARGYHNIDDHGYIHFPDFHFEQRCADENGLVYGMGPIAENFYGLFEEMPLYINEHSAFATAWPGGMDVCGIHAVAIAPGDFPAHLEPIHKKYEMMHGIGGKNHLCPDMKIGLDLGWGGLLKKIRHYREINNPADTSFYDGEEKFVLGMQIWIKRHVDYARELAAKETDPWKKQNYLDIAEINEWLIDNAPRNLREACQFIVHFDGPDRIYCAGGALGQLDEYLRPYYEKDIAAGLIRDEDVIWYVSSLLFHDTHYCNLGGMTPDGGREYVSRMTFLIIDAVHHLNIPQNIAVRVYDGMHPELLERCLEYTMEDGSGVCYSLAQGCEEGFVRNGFPIEIARCRIKSGCNWTAIPGREYPLQDVTRINMGYALVYAMQDMREAGEQYSLEALWERFAYHVGVMVDCIKQGYDRHYEAGARAMPEIVLNLFMHGPIERGLDVAQGGVDILHYNLDGLGLATVADSFAAVEQRVVKEGKLSWERLYELLDTDFKDAERERLMLKNIERFGAPGSPAEKWALRIRDMFVGLCRQSPTPKHSIRIIPGLFSHGDILTYGKNLPATPNGRRKGDALSHSGEPDPDFARGLNTFSPTLKATAVAKIQPGFGNSSPLHLDIDSEMLAHEGGIEALEQLIHAHNRMGGTLINLNCLTKQKLLEAHEDPQKHPDLVVRVTGYSAFFASLSKDYRQQIIDRFLSKTGA